ncbi:MAG TPA: MAPEG family protein [Gammaproteobacteria bacterium]
MENKVILYPLFALVAWTLFMTVVMIRRAFRAVGEGLDPEYFRYGKGFTPPGYMLSAYQHFENLFEMPVLFYVALSVIYVTHINNALLLTLAWGYVAARMVHSVYHLDNTNVKRRRNAFITSFVILIVLWVSVVVFVTVGQ